MAKLSCVVSGVLFTAGAALVLCCSAVAQATSGSPVTGRVVYGDTGKPATGINVWLTLDAPRELPVPDPQTGEFVMRDVDRSQQRLLAKVGPTGDFTLSGVAPGTYLVHTYAPPYLSPDDTVYPTSNTGHVATGPQAAPSAMRIKVTAGMPAHVDVRLRLGGAIEGTVRMGDDSTPRVITSPPYGIAVNAERRLGPNSYARTGGAAHTDQNGHYRLDALGPGDYILFAAGPNEMVKHYGGGLRGGSGLPVYATGTVRPSQATVVHIAGTETKRLNLSLFPETSLHRVSGRIALNDAAVLRDLVVRLYPSGEGGLTGAMPLDATGNFNFNNVPDGDYTVSVDLPGGPELVGMTPDGKGLRMRMRKPAYTAPALEVHVSGADRTDLLIAPTRTDSAGPVR